MNQRFLSGDPLYPGHGYPPNPGEDRPGLSPFGRLAMGQTIGKSSILIFDPRDGAPASSPVSLVTLQGDSLDAVQIVVTLHPPRVIPLSIEEVRRRLNQQNLTGEQTNSAILAAVFPGTERPIQWPPLEAAIEFGTGGVNTEVVVDYLNGATIAVEASYLRVHAVVTQTHLDKHLIGTRAAYYLAAHVGPGFAQSRAQRTIFVGEIAAGAESDVFDVPRFARRATIVGTRCSEHPELTIGFIRFFQSPDGSRGVADYFIDALTSNSCSVDVPNSGQYFSVVNRAKHTMRMIAVFDLAL